VALSPSSSGDGAAEAQRLLARASALTGKNPVPAVQLMIAMQTARTRVAAGGNAVDAHKGLEAAFAEMGAKSGFDVRLEARLVLAELRSKTGDSAGAVSALDGVEKEAASHGFLLAARKAKTLSAAIHK